MPALSDSDRALCYSDFVADVGSAREAFGTMTKAELRTALNDVDTWLVANAAAFNAAISQPARGAMTIAQKARLMMAVARYRYIKGA